MVSDIPTGDGKDDKLFYSVLELQIQSGSY